MSERMPVTTKAKALDLAARFIQADLDDMRKRAVEYYEHARRVNPEGGGHDAPPVTSSHEGDLLKAVEWASAIVWLRAMAESEGS